MLFDMQWLETLFLLQHNCSGGRLPSGSEELENMSDNQESLALAACEVQQAATGDLHAGI